MAVAMIEHVIDFLLQAQNPDGGWGAATGKRSNTEATSFSILGLSTLGDRSLTLRINLGLNWLADRQKSDGSWSLTTHLKESSWTTALAILALAPFEQHGQKAIQGARWLLHQEGDDLGWIVSVIYRLAPERLPARLNPDLKGWPWTFGTFSWVEPTAYALIALKKLKPYLEETRFEERIREGELMIYDRMCDGGGWNYGNPEVLAVNLWPYPETTALALIALQDHQKAEANRLSLQALRNMLMQVESGLALSWSTLCFSLYGQDISEWRQRLTNRYGNTGFLGEIKTVALALLALGDGPNPFRV